MRAIACFSGVQALAARALLAPALLCLASAASAQVELVSKGAVAGQLPANGSSIDPRISGDGRYIAFETTASNLGAAITASGYYEVVLRDTVGDTWTVASRNGATPANDDSFQVDISADGNLVVFTSQATNLVAGDTNGYADIFVYNRTAATLTRVTPGPGLQGNGDSFLPRISGNGTRVAFQSNATNWVAGDTNGAADLFVVTLADGTVQRASLGDLGQEPNNGVLDHSISADGQCVAFNTAATNVVAGDGNAKPDVFLRNLASATTTRVSTSSTGQEANGESLLPRLGPDCNSVAFASFATNLNADVLNAGSAAVFKDLVGGTVTRIWPAVAAPATGLLVDSLEVSRDGGFAAIGGGANLNGANNAFAMQHWQQSNNTLTPIGTTPGWTGGMSNGGAVTVFYTDKAFDATDKNVIFDVGAFTRSNSTIAQITAPLAGLTSAANGVSGNASYWSPGILQLGATHSHFISADGRYVLFPSQASNIVAGDTNGFEDVFLRDRLNGTTIRVSVPTGGGEANGDSWANDLSPDARYVVFESTASNLVPGDTNGVADLFLLDRDLNTIERVNVSTAGAQVTTLGTIQNGHFGSISADGRYVAFSSDAANDLVTGLGYSNTRPYIFVRDRVASTTSLLFTGLSAAQPNGQSLEPRISRDGSTVAFRSGASNLVSGDTNATADVFVAAVSSGLVERVSVATGGAQANGASTRPFISDNGRYVVISSVATNLVAGDTNAAQDVFLRDRTAGTTIRVSLTPSGGQAAGAQDSFIGGMSALGDVVGFISNETVGQPSTLYAWRKDASGQSGTVTQLFAAPAGIIQMGRPVVSADGQFLAFTDISQLLVPPDGNGQIRDVFVVPFPTAATGNSGLVPAEVLPPPPPSSGLAGSSVAVAPGVVAAGAPDADIDGAIGGEVYVYELGTGAANRPGGGPEQKLGLSRKALADVNLATLQLPIPINADKLGGGGVAVSRDGSTVVVGAPGVNGGQGAVYVFKRPQAGWTSKVLPTQTLVPANTFGGYKVGASLTMTNAGTVLVGAPGAQSGGQIGAGKVYVLRKTGDSYAFAESLQSSLPQPDAQFGASVAGEGADVVVGSPNQTVGQNTGQGAVVTFREPTSGGPYTLQDFITDVGGSLADKFGTAVGISGGTVVVGAPGRDQPSAEDAGAAVVFQQPPTGPIAPVAVLQDPTPDPGAALGTAVQVRDGTIAASAPLEDLNGNVDQGTVFVYVPTFPGETYPLTLFPTAVIYDPLGEAGDRYGQSFALGEQVAAVGEPYAGATAVAKGAGAVAPGQVVAYTDSVIFKDDLEAPRDLSGTCQSPGTAIPDNSPSGIDSDIALTAAGDARDIEVSVRISHTFASDLKLTLKHVPSGTTIPLYVAAADCPTDNLDVTFDDKAVAGYAKASCSQAAPALSGRLLGNEWLSVLRGKTRAGPWRLNVADLKAADAGTLVAWCIDTR